MRLRHLLAVSLLLVGLTWATYAGILHNSFLAEDFWQAQLWLHPAWWIKFATLPGGGGYRPFMFMGWAAWGVLWDTQPFPYRVLAMGGHLLNVCLVYAIAQRLHRRREWSVVAAGLFAVFPTSAEAVNWLSAASNQLLCVFGYLLGLRALIPWVTTSRPQRKWLALSFLGMLLALGSNEMSLTWPAAALIVAAWANPPTRFGDWMKQQASRLWPLAVGWLIFLTWRTVAVNGLGGYGAAVHLRGGLWLWEALRVYLNYFLQPLHSSLAVGWPMAWAAFYADHRIIETALLALGGSLLIVGTIWLAWRGRHALALALVFLVPAWTIPALHRGYLMGAGLAWVASSVFTGNWWRAQRWRMGVALVALVCTLWAVAAERQATLDRNAQWIAASQWAQQVLRETTALEPAPADGTVFYYYDLPQFYNTVYAFTWGLPQAVRAHYHNDTLQAYQVYATASERRIQANLERSLEQVAQATTAPQVYLVYQPAAAGLLLRRVSREEFLRLASDTGP